MQNVSPDIKAAVDRIIAGNNSKPIRPNPEHKKNILKKLKLIPVLLVFTVIFVVSAIFLYMRNNNYFNKMGSLQENTFEECVKAGGVITKDDPNTCVIQDQTFEQPIAEEPPEKEESEISWINYSDDTIGVSFEFPNTWGEPIKSANQLRYKVVFNSNLTIEKGRYIDLTAGTPLTFQKFIDQNTPFNKTVLDHTIDNVNGKRFIYRIGESIQETMIAFRLEGNEILTISFKSYPSDFEQNILISKAISTITFKETAESNNTFTSAECVIGGCNNEICTDIKAGLINSICIYDSKYACYKDAECRIQEDDKCGWTQTEELSQCFSSTSGENQ